MSVTTQRINGHAPIRELSPREVGALAKAAFNVDAYAAADSRLTRAQGSLAKYAAYAEKTPGQASRELVQLRLMAPGDPRIRAAQARDDGELRPFADEAEMKQAARTLADRLRQANLPREAATKVAAMSQMIRQDSLTPYTAAVAAEGISSSLVHFGDDRPEHRNLALESARMSVASIALYQNQLGLEQIDGRRIEQASASRARSRDQEQR